MSADPIPELRTLAVEIDQTKDGAIAWLTINRSEALNALSGELLREFALLLDHWSHPYSMLGDEAELPKDSPRVIILRSAGGKAFSSGVDIKARRVIDQVLLHEFWGLMDFAFTSGSPRPD